MYGGDDNDFGMSDDDLLYREMNPDDPWYMGSRGSYPPPCRRRSYAPPPHPNGRAGRWSTKKQFFAGLLLGLILIGVISLLAWLGHVILD